MGRNGKTAEKENETRTPCKHIDYDQFVRIWQNSETFTEACSRLDMHPSTARATYKRIAKFNGGESFLKELFSTKRGLAGRIDELKKIAQESLPE